MNIDQFAKLPRGEFEIQFWEFEGALETPIGEFSIVLAMEDKGDETPPDEEMLRVADEAVDLVGASIEEIRNIILASHKSVAEEQGYLLAVDQIPIRLKRSELGKFIVSRKIIIARHRTNPGMHYSWSVLV